MDRLTLCECFKNAFAKYPDEMGFVLADLVNGTIDPMQFRLRIAALAQEWLPTPVEKNAKR